jgi:hypothetical protein
MSPSISHLIVDGSARLAVTALLGLTEELPETYKGLEHPWALVTALKRILA